MSSPVSSPSTDSSSDGHMTEPPQSVEPSQSISPPPGPSGLPYAFLSPSQPSVQNVSASGSRPAAAALDQGGSVASGNRQMPTNQMQPSQDILTGSHEPSMGLDESQSVGVTSPSLPPGPPSIPLQYDLTPRDLQSFIPARSEMEEVGVAQERGMADESSTADEDGPGDDQEVDERNAAEEHVHDEPIERGNRHVLRMRDRVRGALVPTLSGTESSQSSDEGRAFSMRERLNRGVPQSNLSFQQTSTAALGNQLLPATSSESGLSSTEAKVPVSRHRKGSVHSATDSGSKPVETRKESAGPSGVVSTPKSEEGGSVGSSAVQGRSKPVKMRKELDSVGGRPEDEDHDEGEGSETEGEEEDAQQSAIQDTSSTAYPPSSIRLGTPSWGAETDASTEYAGTPTTSSWTDKTVSSSDDGVVAMETQPLSQADPLVSSTPYEDDTPPLHRYPRRFKITRSKKQLSDETTTSSTTNTSSSSSGPLEKIMIRQTFSSQWTQEQSVESVPLALQTPEQETVAEPQALTGEHLKVPSSLQSDIDTQPLDDDSQDLFHIPTVAIESQEDLANEKPAWYAQMEAEDTQPSDIETPSESYTTPVEKPSSQEQPSIDSQSTPLSQPRKRKREEDSQTDDDDDEQLPKWQKLEQAQESAQSRRSSHSVSFKTPSAELPSSQKSKDSSFSGSQGQTTSSSSSSTQSKSTDTSINFPSSDSSYYPGSLSSSSGESGGGTSGHSSSVTTTSSVTPSSVPSSVSSEERQDRRDGSVKFDKGSASASLSQTTSPGPAQKLSLGESVEPEQSPVKEADVTPPIAEDVSRNNDESVTTVGEDNDSAVTLDAQSPIVIDLTCQSQSQSLIELDSCQNSPVILDEAQRSSKIPRTPVKDSEQPEVVVMIRSPSTKSDSPADDERGMDVDPLPPSSFCLQLSPSQSHSLRGTSTDRSTSNVSNSNPDSEGSEQNTEMDTVSDMQPIEVENQRKSDKDDTDTSTSQAVAVAKSQGPLYESLILDSSNLSESLLSSGKSEVVKSVSASGPQSEGKAQDESTPLQTPTGTPFRLNIPSGSLIEPLSTITPPSQPAACPPSSAPTPPLSPSFSDPAPPPSSTDSRQNQVSKSIDSSKGQNQVSDSSKTQNKIPDSDNCKSTSAPEKVSAIAASPLMLFSSTESGSTSSRSSKQSNTDSSFVLHLQTTTSESSVHSEMETNVPQPQAIEQVDKASTTNSAHSDSSNVGDEKCQNDNSDEILNISTDARNSRTDDPKATPAIKTPRKSLSLKNRRTPRRGKERSSTPSEPQASEFVLGMHSQDSEQSPIDPDSQLPNITVPRDSQFESSDSSDPPFCIPLPVEKPTADTPGDTRQSEQEVSKSLFASFHSGSTSRTVGRSSLAGPGISSQALEDVFGRRGKDPYEYDSQSQEGEVQFVPARRLRNKQHTLLDVSSRSTDRNVAQKQVLSSTDADTERNQVADSLASASQSTHPESHSSRLDSQSRRSGSESKRTGSQSVLGATCTTEHNANSEITLSQSNTQGNQFVPQGAASSQDLITPSNSQTANLALSSFQSPLPSAPVEFTSPITMLSPSGMEDLKKQVQREGVNRFELRHVRTVKTVIEQRIVSSEVIENNRVVQGSSRVWPENCEPVVFQEAKVEMAPHQTLSSSFSITTHSPHIMPTTVIQNVGPSMNIINSPTTLIESPIPSLRRGNESNRSLPSASERGNPSTSRGSDRNPIYRDNERDSRAITPSTSHRSNRPPVRRVHPILSNTESESSSQTEHNSSCSEKSDSCATTLNEQPSMSATTKNTKAPKANAPSNSSVSSKKKTKATKVTKLPKKPTPAPKNTTVTKPPKTPIPTQKDTTVTDQALLEVGSKVIAKWKDKCWYMATITSEGKQGRRRVEYADGDTGTAGPSTILPIDCLKKGLPVSAMPVLPSSQSQSADIPTAKTNGLFGGFSGSDQERFQLQCGGAEVKVFSSACLCVHSESIKMCKEGNKQTPKPTNVVVTRKRKRQSLEESSTPAPAKKKRPLQSAARDVSEAQEALFKGYVFMLTQRQKDGSGLASPKTELNRERMSQQISSRGGTIEDTFTNQVVSDSMAFVLSDNFCKTRKFLQGLALDVPCVSYSWISDCIEQGTIVDYSDYRLPVGISESDGKVVHWSPMKRSSLLEDESIHLIGGEKFKSHWACVAEACGAQLLPKLPTMTARSHTSMGPTRVVCEHSDLITPSLLHQVSSSGDTIHILNKNWILQSLIQGQVLPHHKFQMKK